MTKFEVWKRKKAKQENVQNNRRTSLRIFSEALKQDLVKAGYYS